MPVVIDELISNCLCIENCEYKQAKPSTFALQAPVNTKDRRYLFRTKDIFKNTSCSSMNEVMKQVIRIIIINCLLYSGLAIMKLFCFVFVYRIAEVIVELMFNVL